MKKQRFILASIGGLIMLAISFGINTHNIGVAQAQSVTSQVAKAEPDKETNDDAISPKTTQSNQEKLDANEKEQSGPDTDAVEETK